MPDDDHLVLVEHELAVLLRRARSFSGHFAKQFHPDLDASAYALMIWLDEVGSARLTDLAAFFGVGKPTVSRQIQLLERLDLVTRTVDDTDRRSQALSLTPGGTAQLHLVRDARRARFRALLTDWPDAEIEALGHLLGKLNRTIGSSPADTDAPSGTPTVVSTDHSTDHSTDGNRPDRRPEPEHGPGHEPGRAGQGVTDR